MDLLWQQIIIGAAVMLAVGYLVWHFLRRRKKNNCESCAAKQALLRRTPRPTADQQTQN